MSSLPRHRRSGRRVDLLRDQHGHLPLEDRGVGLTPRSQHSHPNRGARCPLGLPPLLGLGP
jgi:hypothetical protein